ncbi:MAG: DegT/DnrJ/EryC1/StrS family aminotransferase [Clostridiales Family XIII bacterium]|jgi:dTDP-4-amino-4,6-dideoxygalactose transaminase|nr:DegT/DnrJ/EryC1/StrS family aminotransferase [Clostridiales Family XIII bacterium]
MEFIDLKSQYRRIEGGLRARLDHLMGDARFVLGRETEELEGRLAEYVGAKHCLACSSGTDALLMPLMMWGIGAGDAVFVPAFSFFATAEAVSLTGASPVFVDVEAGSFNMDVVRLGQAIGLVKAAGRLRPKAVISVDLFGLPARNIEIGRLAAEQGMFFLEDAAQGFGGMIGGKRACSFGDVSATSFFPAKPLGCYGDGGAVFTDSDEYAGMLRSIRVHGQGREKYHNVRLGLNARLDNMQAAVLLEKLDIFDGETERKNEIAGRYGELLGKALTAPAAEAGYRSSWAQYSLLAMDGAERDMLTGRLNAAGVPTAVYYRTPLHRQPVYGDGLLPSAVGGNLSVSEDICERIFSIPMHAYLSDADIGFIAETAAASLNGTGHPCGPPRHMPRTSP